MLWMETFCFYCSVRLGVIVSAIFSMFQGLLTIALLSIFGSSLFKSAKNFVEKDEQYNQDPFIRKIFDGLSERPQSYMIFFDTFLVVHIISCVSAIFGAFKLQKFFLIPYMVSQFLIFIGVLTQHIIVMVILKKIVNLGILIGITLAGGFYILFIGYSWAGGVALYQIIILVNSVKYKTLYGEDPFHPKGRNGTLLGHGTIKNVKIFMTPNSSQISALKRKRFIEDQQQERFSRKIVSVVPADQSGKGYDDIDLINMNYWHWNELVGVRKGYK